MNAAQEKILKNKNYYKNRLEIILPRLNLEGASVLDLGCGEMILFNIAQNQIKSYIGIDRFLFSDNTHFILGDILDKTILGNQSADFVFLLGVLDHLSFNEKATILQSCQNCFNKSIIISQRDPNSFINSFHKNSAPTIGIENFFGSYTIVKLYLLKIPYTGVVYDLSEYSHWIKMSCTEIIYIVSKTM